MRTASVVNPESPRPPGPTASGRNDGVHLGGYRLGRMLGSGGMGTVYEATHTLLNRRAALKVIRSTPSQGHALAQRFRREIASLGRLADHPNLVRAQYAGEENGQLFLVMELVEGMNLNEVLARLGPLDAPTASAIVLQAARGLDAIHQAGMVHRDLKPSNLMIAADGSVKILDLGLARLAGAEADELTPSNCLLGTLDYLAPEQASDPRGVDIRADIYSLGCTLHKLLTGSAPFADAPTPMAKIERRARGEFPLLPDGGNPLSAILAKMVALRPSERFPDPASLAQELGPIAAPPEDVSAILRKALATPSTHHDAAAATLEVPGHEATPRYLPFEEKRRPVVRWMLAAGMSVVAAVVLALIYLPRDANLPSGDAQLPAADQPAKNEPPKTPPVAATIPVLDSLPELQWHDLLEREPYEVLLNKADGRASARFDAKLRQHSVVSPQNGLFIVGETHRPSFTFQVSLNQVGWQMGAGIVLGYKASEAANGGRGRFQYFVFESGTDAKGQQTVHLVRGTAKLETTIDAIQFRPSTLGSQQVIGPLGEQVIEVVVARGAVRQVRVNGAPMERLTRSEINAEVGPDMCDGGVGFCATATTCSFRKANIKLQPVQDGSP